MERAERTCASPSELTLVGGVEVRGEEARKLPSAHDVVASHRARLDEGDRTKTNSVCDLEAYGG